MMNDIQPNFTGSPTIPTPSALYLLPRRGDPFLPPAQRIGRKKTMEVGIRSLGKAIDDADHNNSFVDRNESAAMCDIDGYHKE
jgi:hypothetical protein